MVHSFYDISRHCVKKQRHHLANKAMVFPAVMCGCEGRTIKKAELWKIDAFELWCWRRLESPLDSKEINPVNPKGNQSWVFIRKTDARAEVPVGHLIWRADSLEKTLMLEKNEGKRRGDGLDSFTNSVDMNLSKLWKTVEDRKVWCAAIHGVAKNQTQLNDK